MHCVYLATLLRMTHGPSLGPHKGPHLLKLAGENENSKKALGSTFSSSFFPLQTISGSLTNLLRRRQCKRKIYELRLNLFVRWHCNHPSELGSQQPLLQTLESL
jgi:hypothetical protein